MRQNLDNVRPRVLAIFMVVTALITWDLTGASLSWVEDLQHPLAWKEMRIPKWSHGGLMAVQYANNTNNPLIWIVEHQRTYSVPFSISGARSVNIYDWDRNFDGTRIALSGSGIDPSGRSGYFIALMSSDGSNCVVSRISPYMPRRIAFAPDGTLWTAGEEFSGRPDSGVLRHFDQTGKLLEEFVPRSSFPDPIVPYEHSSRLAVSKDRVAWYSPRGGRYIEISLQSKAVTNISVTAPGDENNGYGFGLTDQGDAYLSSGHNVSSTSTTPGYQLWRVSILDKETSTWKPIIEQKVISGSATDFGHIYGVDRKDGGDRLVMAGEQRVRFYKLER